MSGTRYTVDSDGDVEMSIPQPIFEVIRPPELSSWDHAALIDWQREWDRYVAKIRHRCSTTGETYENVVATVRGSVKPKTLKNMATYVLKKPVASVTDVDILAAVQARCRTLKNEFVPDVTSLFRQKLKMDLMIDDCDARIFRYYEDFNAIMEDNGLQGLIGGDNVAEAGHKSRMKARCRLLVENLQPPVLKAQITRLIDLERRDCKVDDVALFDLILEHAKVQQRFHRLSKEYAGKESGSKGTKDGLTKSAKATSKASVPATPAATASKPPSKPPSIQGGRPARPPRPPPVDGCLVCKGQHWLVDCPVATDVQREEALRKFQAAKEQRADARRTKAAKYAKAAGTVKINGLVEAPYMPDTGSDHSVVPQGIVDSLYALQPTLRIVSTPQPVEAVMADGRVQKCTQEVSLDLELTTLAGLVSLRSVPCLILAGDGDEFLLGSDVLKGLGIDIEQQLAQLAGPTLLEADVDEFPAGDDIPVPQVGSTAINQIGLLLNRAVANGLPTEQAGAVRNLLEEFPDVWRDEVGLDPPANVEPLRVTLQANATPFRSPPRKYAPLQAQFIREYVKTLVDSGLVEQNNASRWACAVVPVRKPGTQDKFRLTIDYRPVNRLTIPIAGTMPSVADHLIAFQEKKVFGRFDFTQGFWQLPLHEDSREIFSFVTPDGVFTPGRVPQGAMDSALHFQSQIQTKLAPLIPHSALVWVDDVILFAPTVEEFLKTLRAFFEIVVEANFKLNMAKSSLFELEILWCGRLISGAGVRHDPSRVSALTELPAPSTVADLQYFVCATNWLHDSLPDYARVIAPLQEKLNAERSRIGRRNRNALNVATTWSAGDQAAYDAVVALVRDSALMAFPDPEAELLLFTDASATGYSIVVTQVKQWDASLPVDEQKHEMIICKGGLFKHSELNWTVVEKEAFPIVQACHDLEYLLLRPKGFRLYCDHANLAYIFAPSVELKKHVRDRLQRWAMRLCGLHYTIEHIPGEKNVWADIISRWHSRKILSVAAVRTRRQHATAVEDLSRLRPLSDAGFVFPTSDDIKDAQQAATRERFRLPTTAEEVDGVVTLENHVWIPTAAKELLARIFVVAHCGSQGHRGQESMVLALKERFYISRLEDKVATFVRQCLLCKHFKGPRQIPRPYGPLMTPTERNEIVHWDFLSLGEGFGDSSYLLVVKDGLSHFCELFPCASPTAYIAAEALTMWCSRYGVPSTLQSDQGSHFRNETVKNLATRLKVELSFTPVYSPWLNGTVERLNKDVLQVLRALLMEYALDHHEWPYVLPAIQANLNHTRVHSLAGHAPVEVFTALPASSALDAIVMPATTERGERVIDLTNVGEFVDRLRSSLHAMHKEVADVKERQRLRDMAAHKGSLVNFDVGDFVLWSRIDQRLPHHKLLAQWVGPFKVVAAGPYTFEIEHLVTGRKYEVHPSRLKFYADAELNTTTELLELVSSQGMLLGVDRFIDHRFNQAFNRWELLVSWLGLQAVENSWEPLDTLFQDVPTKVREYVASSDDDDLRAQLD